MVEARLSGTGVSSSGVGARTGRGSGERLHRCWAGGGRVLVLASAGAVAACGGDPGGLTLSVGVDLLRELEHARLLQHPDSNLPPAVAAALEHLGPAPAVVIAPEDWAGGALLGRDAVGIRDLPGAYELGEGVRRWVASTPFPLDLPWMRCRLQHDGRLLERVNVQAAQAASQALVWWDETERSVFWWEPGRAPLYAFGSRRPGRVKIDCTEAGPARAAPCERRLDSRPGRTSGLPVRAADLQRRIRWRGESRPGLLLPAPGALAFAVRGEPGTELRLSVAVVDQAFVLEGGMLRNRAGAGDGVTFAVEVELDGSTRQLWSLHVLPGTGWHPARVPLGPLQGARGLLRLVTEAGPAGDAFFDYGAWSDLGVVGAGGAAPGRPHVVILDVDTLRSDRMSLYGHQRVTTPHLAAWAAERATVYRNALSNASWTLPSTASLLTGLDVHQHGLTRADLRLGESTPLLAETLHAAGYETLAITASGYVAPAYGFDRGFDRFLHAWDADGAPDWGPALDWLDERSATRPVFLFLHT